MAVSPVCLIYIHTHTHSENGGVTSVFEAAVRGPRDGLSVEGAGVAGDWKLCG
jgi:hypothetical protein